MSAEAACVRCWVRGLATRSSGCSDSVAAEASRLLGNLATKFCLHLFLLIIARCVHRQNMRKCLANKLKAKAKQSNKVRVNAPTPTLLSHQSQSFGCRHCDIGQSLARPVLTAAVCRMTRNMARTQSRLSPKNAGDGSKRK